MSEVINIKPDIDKSSRETNVNSRKTRQAELNNKLVKSVSLDTSCIGTSDSHKKIKLTDTNDEVSVNIMLII